MGDKFEIVTAFSREGSKKVYVQHRLKERSAEVNELLKQKAYFYVCGDAANMAREVNTVLAQILAEGRGVSEQKGEEIVKSMRGANQYQVSCPPARCCILVHLLTLSIGGCLVLNTDEWDGMMTEQVQAMKTTTTPTFYIKPRRECQDTQRHDCMTFSYAAIAGRGNGRYGGVMSVESAIFDEMSI
jgi:hypothetical protein